MTAEPVSEIGHSGPGQRGTEVNRVHRAAAGESGQRGQRLGGREPTSVVDVPAQHLVVSFGEPLDELVVRRGVVGWPDASRSAAGADRQRERDRVAREGGAEVGHRPVVRCTVAIDLVRKDEKRDPEPLEDADQHSGLRLHTFDGGDDEHRPVEHGEGSLHLGHEVGVAGCVDQVDLDVAEVERDHGGADGDAPAAFERVGVRDCVAVVDTAGGGDDPGLEQESLGQRGLTGIDVRDDAEVESGHADGSLSAGSDGGLRSVRAVGASSATSSRRCALRRQRTARRARRRLGFHDRGPPVHATQERRRPPVRLPQQRHQCGTSSMRRPSRR